MPINPGERPVWDPPEPDGASINKFIGRRGEGHRGTLIGLREDRLQAVVLAATTSSDPGDGVTWGRLYLIKEKDPAKWPFVVREVQRIPGTKRWSMVALTPPWALRRSTFKYDVCLSFAGENRAYVSEVARLLRLMGVKVFYDKYEMANLWGANLYEHLADVYQRQAQYCVMFISQHYASKVWPSHERRAAQARALVESSQYVLPARFDDTDVPGLLPTLGYIDLTTLTPVEVADLITAKLGAPAATSR